MNFLKYVTEMLDAVTPEELIEIKELLKELEDEDLDDFGYVLYSQFFDCPELDEDDEYECEPFTINDILDMVDALGSDAYDIVVDLLDEFEDFDGEDGEDGEDELDELDELDEAGPARRMKTKNMNKKKRKYMTLRRTDLRKTAAVRKRQNRMNKMGRKRYYNKNKMKIKSYQTTRKSAIEKGRHKVKIRRQ